MRGMVGEGYSQWIFGDDTISGDGQGWVDVAWFVGHVTWKCMQFSELKTLSVYTIFIFVQLAATLGKDDTH